MIPKLGMCRCIISIGKITHQKWCNHPFKQRHRATKTAVEVEVRGIGQNLKKGVDNIGGSS